MMNPVFDALDELALTASETWDNKFNLMLVGSKVAEYFITQMAKYDDADKEYRSPLSNFLLIQSSLDADLKDSVKEALKKISDRNYTLLSIQKERKKSGKKTTCFFVLQERFNSNFGIIALPNNLISLAPTSALPVKLS